MQSFTFGVIWSFGSRIWGLIAGLIVSIVVTRALGPAGRGQVALLGLISSISVMLAYMNIPGSTIYHLNRKKWQLKRMFKSQLLFTTVTTCLGMMIALLIYMFWPDQNVKQLPPIAMIFVPGIIAITIYSNNIGSILSALREFSVISIISMTTATIAIPAYLIALWFYRGGVVGWALVGMLVPLVGLVMTGIMVFPKMFQKTNSENFRKRKILSDCSSILSFGIVSQLGNIAWFLTLKADQFIISGILTVEALGFYAVAAGIAENLRLIPMTFGQVLFPYAADKDRQERKLFICACVRLTFWAMILLGAILIALANPIITVLFGGDFLPAVLPFQILVAGIVFLSIGNMLGYEFNAIGRPKLILYCNLICGAFNILFNFIIVPQYGLTGAAWVSFITYTLNSLIIIFLAIRTSGYRLQDIIFPSKIDFLILKESYAKIMPNSSSHLKMMTSK
jgi:O-antigen/teichoic acid export membrane protein